MSKRMKSIDNLMSQVDKRIASAINAGIAGNFYTAQELSRQGEQEIKKIIDHPGSYKTYGSTKKQRMSSRPGEPPSADPSGPLYKSIYSQTLSKVGDNPARAVFGSKLKYARFLEYGTERMAPRPFARPARENIALGARKTVANAFTYYMYKRFKGMKPLNVTIKVGE